MKQTLFLTITALLLSLQFSITTYAESIPSYLEEIHAQEGYEMLNTISDYTKPTTIAIIDTGVDYTHADLAPYLWKNEAEADGAPDTDDDNNGYVDDIYGYDFLNDKPDPMDDSIGSIQGHGTHIAGIILRTAGCTNGQNPYNIQLMCLKAGDARGNFSSAALIKAINYAVHHGAEIINLSIGSKSLPAALTHCLTEASKHCILVAAAGNGSSATVDANLSGSYNCYPAVYPYVVGVMSHGSNHQLSSFSNWDAIFDNEYEYNVCAPGEQISSTTYQQEYKNMTGTSMATGVVTGCGALLISKYKQLGVPYSIPSLAAHMMNCGEQSITKTSEQPPYGYAYRKFQLDDLLCKNPVPALSLRNLTATKQITDTGITLQYEFYLYNKGADCEHLSIELNGSGQQIDALAACTGSSINRCSRFFSSAEYARLPDNISETISLTYEDPVTGETFHTMIPFTLSLQDGSITDITPEHPVIPVTDLALNAKQVLMQPGGRQKLSVTTFPSNATEQLTFLWESSNPKVVTVDESGNLTGQNAGTAMITITASNGLKQSAIVNVVSIPADSPADKEPDAPTDKKPDTPTDKEPDTPTDKEPDTPTDKEPDTPTDKNPVIPIDKITLNETNIVLRKGQRFTLKTKLLPANATAKLTWHSKNSSIAKIYGNGLIKAMKPGTTTVTVSTENGHKASCKVTVYTTFYRKNMIKMLYGNEILTIISKNGKLLLYYGKDRKQIARIPF